jgi:hypothetical protein
MRLKTSEKTQADLKKSGAGALALAKKLEAEATKKPKAEEETAQ